ncbi:MAG: hypothetical protein HDQ88_11045 [Clostridia bacterium]|nr:hypothetical protein [Clostridia bacterium]
MNEYFKWSHQNDVKTHAGTLAERIDVVPDPATKKYKAAIYVQGIVKNTGAGTTQVTCTCPKVALANLNENDAVLESAYYLLGLYAQINEKLGIAAARINYSHQDETPERIDAIIAGNYQMKDIDARIEKTGDSDVKLTIGLELKTERLALTCETVGNEDRFDTVLHFMLEDVRMLVCRLVDGLSHLIIEMGRDPEYVAERNL